MAELSAFSDRDITTRDRLEDYAVDAVVTTAGGLTLQVAMVCDGAGGGEAGELASRLTARTILEFLEISAETNIPKLLVKAVGRANRVVYSELRGAGTSTVSLVVVDLNDGPHGRLYLASVGNSRIYLMRDGRLVRLNIDHTLANEYVYAGQMSFAEGARLENADYVTRVIGINTDVQPDIGFYAERGKAFVNAYRAFRIGQKGMLLKEGDTVFVASDGMFESGRRTGRAFVRDDEFLKHALDDNVEHAVRALMRYASARRPDDNTSISMFFVPSRSRKAVRVGPSLSFTQKAGLGLAFGLVILVAAFMGAQALATAAESARIRSTQVAFRETVLRASSTPTPSFTPTSTPTHTPTPTATPRPTIVAADQVGFQYFESQPSQPVFMHRLAFSPEINFLLVQGANNLASDSARALPANIYLQPETVVDLNYVLDSPGREALQVLLYPEGDLYANAGDFLNGGLEVALQQDAGIRFHAQTACVAVKQIPADMSRPDDTDKVAFTCFTGQQNDCYYQLPGQDPIQIPIGVRVLLDVEKKEQVEAGPLVYEEVKTYFDTVSTLTESFDQAQCLNAALDTDGDRVYYPHDQCSDQAGTDATGGCPDADRDTVVDAQDQCPDTPGPVESGGCPVSTATPFPDSDGDGLNDAVDQCPLEAGVADNYGCPAGVTATPEGRG